MNFRVASALVVAGALAAAGTVRAQQFTFTDDDHEHIRVHVHDATRRHVMRHVGGALSEVQPNDEPCRDAGWHDDDYRTCEVREYTTPAGPLVVDGSRNGGIRVQGWDRGEVRVEAVVVAHGRSEQDARQLAAGVQVEVDGGRVRATGPSSSGREWWSVSYRISVPRRSDLDLRASNGGISVDGVSGTIRFDTRNGGVRLTNLGGDVRGTTRNGGVTVALTGNRWDGAGLDVETSNGAITLTIPDGYNADLTTGTVNGSFRTEYPMTVTGELSPRRGVSTTLGTGGPPVRVRTTNGALRINRR